MAGSEADAAKTGNNRDSQQYGLGALPKTLLVHIPSNENQLVDHRAGLPPGKWINSLDENGDRPTLTRTRYCEHRRLGMLPRATKQHPCGLRRESARGCHAGSAFA